MVVRSLLFLKMINGGHIQPLQGCFMGVVKSPGCTRGYGNSTLAGGDVGGLFCPEECAGEAFSILAGLWGLFLGRCVRGYDYLTLSGLLRPGCQVPRLYPGLCTFNPCRVGMLRDCFVRRSARVRHLQPLQGWNAGVVFCGLRWDGAHSIPFGTEKLGGGKADDDSIKKKQKKHGLVHKNLSGIEDAGGVEELLDAFHQLQLHRIEGYVHIPLLHEANAMLAGYGATHFYNFRKQFADAKGEVVIPGVFRHFSPNDIDMQIAIAGMAITDRMKAIFFTQSLDHLQQMGQEGAGNDGVFFLIHRIALDGFTHFAP